MGGGCVQKLDQKISGSFLPSVLSFDPQKKKKRKKKFN
jgi:hypothetical protein